MVDRFVDFTDPITGTNMRGRCTGNSGDAYMQEVEAAASIWYELCRALKHALNLHDIDGLDFCWVMMELDII